jgi:hypothetical protein
MATTMWKHAGKTLLALAVAVGCAHRNYIPGTTVADSEDHRKIIERVEEYRQRLLEKNVEGLLILASDRYFEDSGTPRADDDYGYDGLKHVLTTRLARLRSLRYEIQYRNIRLAGNRAEVEVFLNGAFELASDTGERYRRVSDFHRFVLERTDSEKWKFLSGM